MAVEGRLPEGQIQLRSTGIPMRGGDRGPNDDLAVVFHDGLPICHIPYTKAEWFLDHSGPLPTVRLTFLAGPGETSTREIKDQCKDQ